MLLSATASANWIPGELGNMHMAQVGYNAGHSTVILLEAMHDMKITSFDICRYKYTNETSRFLETQSEFRGRHKLICGDSQLSVGTTPIILAGCKYPFTKHSSLCVHHLHHLRHPSPTSVSTIHPCALGSQTCRRSGGSSGSGRSKPNTNRIRSLICKFCH